MNQPPASPDSVFRPPEIPRSEEWRKNEEEKNQERERSLLAINFGRFSRNGWESIGTRQEIIQRESGSFLTLQILILRKRRPGLSRPEEILKGRWKSLLENILPKTGRFLLTSLLRRWVQTSFPISFMNLSILPRIFRENIRICGVGKGWIPNLLGKRRPIGS